MKVNDILQEANPVKRWLQRKELANAASVERSRSMQKELDDVRRQRDTEYDDALNKAAGVNVGYDKREKEKVRQAEKEQVRQTKQQQAEKEQKEREEVARKAEKRERDEKKIVNALVAKSRQFIEDSEHQTRAKRRVSTMFGDDEKAKENIDFSFMDTDLYKELRNTLPRISPEFRKSGYMQIMSIHPLS
jgi:hypothetical protein